VTGAPHTQRPPADPRLARHTIAFAVFLGVLGAFYWRPLATLFQLALSRDTDSHILLVPLVSVALVWMDRGKVFAHAASSPRAAAAVFLGGALLFALRTRLDTLVSGQALLTITILSWVVLIWAGFLLCYGTRSFHAGLFPVLFLLLAVPIPDPVIERIILWLQQGSSEVTYWLFRATGTPVYRSGFIFAVPGQTIEVAQECSGIRSSLAMLITCLLAGYLFLRLAWTRLTLVLATFPMLVIKNGIRIVTLTLLSIHVDPGFLHGQLHHSGGFVFFLIGLIILWPLLVWLQRMESKSRATIAAGAPARTIARTEPHPGQ
jgi:exosortase